MTDKPTLSICVPSRNRQIYFQKTIEGLLRNKRTDVEFIFTDNSDDPAIMNDFMADIVKDPRIVYLPTTDKVLSMMDNWERAAHASQGEWVVFIGDDDFVEPDVAGLILRITEVSPDIEALAWGALSYFWPVDGEMAGSVTVPFDHSVIRVPKADLMRRMFGWHEPTSVPTSGFSIYHSAVRRCLLERIYTKYNHRYFEHAVVDYDMAMKVIVEGKGFAFSQRPFSMFGACPQSNSFSIGRLEDTKERARIFMEEFGANFEENEALRNFPFSSFLGCTATIGVVQQWFRKTYKVDLAGWEKGYAKACALNTESYRDKDAFDVISAGYETAFRNWQGGRFLKHYQPVWRGNMPMIEMSGATSSGMMVRSDIAGATTPAELWNVVSAMMIAPQDILVRPTGLCFLDEEASASGELTRLPGGNPAGTSGKAISGKPSAMRNAPNNRRAGGR
ncbi:glycosyltransferase family 2 protein [Agrobacterium vitis]|uniref:glycosyltransferase family 2 protein n=1 Tax=Agrobacterium vitis TaxID=373 RepID=UPI0012E71C3F|nr:glycosyltransferase family 2 protein [Agrobacterium vitis]MVA35427.1 glycosyltransferase [Agrobacterium vitis]